MRTFPSPQLVVIGGVDRGRSMLLRQGDNVLGRSRVADFVLGDRSVSPQHACVHVDIHGIGIVDLGSATGTTVNGRAVTGDTPISSGDVIAVGSVRLRLLAGAFRVTPHDHRRRDRTPAGGAGSGHPF